MSSALIKAAYNAASGETACLARFTFTVKTGQTQRSSRLKFKQFVEPRQFGLETYFALRDLVLAELPSKSSWYRSAGPRLIARAVLFAMKDAYKDGSCGGVTVCVDLTASDKVELWYEL